MLDLARLIDLERVATPGPWRSVVPARYPHIKAGANYVMETGSPHWRVVEDCAFVAEMRNASPTLLRELQAARACVNALVDLLALVEDGLLVRSVTHDGQFRSFAEDATRLVRVLAGVKDALAPYEAARG